MGKSEENDEFSLSSAAVNGEGISGSNAERGECSLICRVFKLRCFLALLLGISVFLSAVFWLPPFLNFADRSDLDLDPRYRGHTIVASFRLKRPVSFVEDNIEELEGGIYEDFGAANAKVAILSKESSGLNSTDIVFAIDPVFKNSISSAQLSLIRASFVSLVTRQFDFVLIPSLSGESSFFEVLKFPGGITISPPQIAYPLQKVQILFNFTLNNSILQIQENFEVLRNQLKYGLHLTNNENLYIRLTNSRGSTVAPPATVQTSVVLKVGVPSQPRLKQLAQTIRDSPARNLGLNNTVFAPQPVKSAPPPHRSAPSPVRHRRAFPSFAPAPARSYQASPPGAHPPFRSYPADPPGCRFRFRSRHFPKSPQQSPRAPRMPPRSYVASTPHPQAKPPTPVAHQISPSSPLPNVIYARVHPPSASEMDPGPPDKMPSVAPSPSSGDHITAISWVSSTPWHLMDLFVSPKIEERKHPKLAETCKVGAMQKMAFSTVA
uniref:DUF7036 domain-containing protein n=1 Tax=Chenopodium quinoa TaxID=63459 RepID=A0A803LZX7_CHEQI